MIEAYREASVKTRFELSTLSIPATVKTIIDRGEANARLRGELHLAGRAAARRLPFAAERRIDLPGEGAGRPPA